MENNPKLDSLLNTTVDDSIPEFITKKNSKDKRKKIVLLSTITVCVVGVGVSLFYFSPFSGADLFAKNKQINKVAYTPKQDSVDKKIKQEPVELEDWQKIPTIKPTSQVLEKVWKHYSYSELYSDVLPSQQAGYVDNPKMAFDENGLPNPLYTFWTRETFAAQAGDIIERLTNPIYGLSLQSQHTGQDWNLDNIRWVFTPNMVQKANTVPQKSFLPTLIDYDKNRFGHDKDLYVPETPETPLFYPNIKNITTDFIYDDQTQTYTVTAEVDLEYVGWGQDDNKITISKPFEIRFVPNASVDSSQRVLVDDIRLL